MKARPDIVRYNDISWSFTIALCIALLVYSNAARLPVILHAITFSVLLMSPHISQRILSYRTILSWVFGAGVLLIAGTGVLQVRNLPSFAMFMMEVITALLPVSLMHRDKVVSYWLSLLNTTIIAIGCMLFRGDLVVYILLLGFLGSILFNLNAANMFHLAKGDPELRMPLPAGFFRQFLATIPIGIVSGALIFFAFPRVKSIGMMLDISDDAYRTGYTGEISLRGGRPIDESQALAFIAVSENLEWLRKSGWNMHFRGNSLATFDGTKWLPAPPEPEVFTDQDVRVNLRHENTPNALQIFMERNSQDALFYPGSLLSFTGQSKGIGSVLVDQYGNATRSDSSRTRFSYAITTFEVSDTLPQTRQKITAMRTAVQKDLRESPTPYQLSAEAYTLYTSMPQFTAEGDWFEKWVAEVKVDPKEMSVSQAMRSLKIHFSENFEASLVNQFSSADTFKSFLTEDKRGHCEYFSTAATLFFRKLGVPARVVLGYRGGRFNEVARALEVREESAHAWTELFVAGAGWVTFDPTPLGPPTTAGNPLSFVTNYIDAAKFWFNRYVIDYDRTTQRDLIQSIQDFGYKKGSDQWSAVEWLKQVSMPVLGFTAGVIVILAMLRFVRFRQNNAAVPPYYRAYSEFLQKKGHVRSTGETLRDFHGRIGPAIANHEFHLEVAAAIEQDLYSCQPNDQARRNDLLARVRTYRRSAG
jgi:hypothetical protein